MTTTTAYSIFIIVIKEKLGNVNTGLEDGLNFAFIGPGGCGKSTVAERASTPDKLNLAVINSDMFKEYAANPKNKGHEEVQEYIDKFIYVPDEYLERIVYSKLESIDKQTGDDKKNGVIFDNLGSPYNLEVIQKYINLKSVVNFPVSLKEALERAQGRGRNDFSPKKVRNRYDQYRNNLRGIKEMTNITSIDANQTKDEVFHDFMDHASQFTQSDSGLYVPSRMNAGTGLLGTGLEAVTALEK